MRGLLGPWTLGVSLLFSAQVAVGQARPYPECSAEPTESDVAAAKGAFQAGQASFNEADYARAITYWEDAYRRDCTAHALLLNLARAYELGGDKRQAVEALQTYLVRKPESPQKDQINRRIEVLNQQLDQGTAASPSPPAAPDAPESVAPESPTGTATTVESKQITPASENVSDSSNHWVAPVVVGGIGVVVLGAGVVVHAIGRADEDDAIAQCPTRAACDPRVEQLGNDGIYKQKLGVGLMVGGGAALGAGVAWYLLSRPDAKPASTPSDVKATKPASQNQSATAKSRNSYIMLPDLGRDHAGLAILGFF